MNNKVKKFNIPYLRLWVNVFNYKDRTSRKDFFIDFFFLLCSYVLIYFYIEYFMIEFFRNEVTNFLINYCLILFYIFAPLFSLTARRLNDTGNDRSFCFLYILGVIGIFSFVLCCYKTKSDEIDEEQLKLINKKKYKTAGIIAIISYCLPFLLIGCIFIVDIFISPKITHLNTDINDYQVELNNVKNASFMMPNLQDINDYEEIKFSSQEKMYSSSLGFYSYGISLFVKYDENYEVKKEEILSKYIFLNEPIIENDDYIIPITEFEYYGFNYKIVLDESYEDFCACKSFMIIGYDDESKEIAYHYFYDFDIDYICELDENPEEEMKEFMKDNFNYFTEKK